VPNSAVDEKMELKNINILYSLLENRYSRKYALTESLMRPKSNPTHYTDLVMELERAPTRGWVERTVNRLKGMLRFQ